jgi:hypothetical protein
MKFTQEVGVFAYAPSADVYVQQARKDKAITNLMLTSSDMSKVGYAKVGTAVVEVTLDDDADIIPAAVESLRKQQTDIRAEAEFKAQQIEDRIQSMLAICYDAAVA